MLILSSFGFFKSYGVDKVSVNFEKSRLDALLAEYTNWNINLPTERLPEEGKQCVIKPGEVNLLLDPFSKGTVTQTCDIKKGTSLFFPFYDGWCDNGNRDTMVSNLTKKY
jgi:hypothetical protein